MATKPSWREILDRMGPLDSTGSAAHYLDPETNRDYIQTYGLGHMEGSGENGQWVGGAPTGYWGYDYGAGGDNTRLSGKPYDIYNNEGDATGKGTFKQFRSEGDHMMDVAKGAAVMGAIALGGGALAGGGGGAGAGAVGANFGVYPTAAELAAGMHIPGSALSAGAGALGAAGPGDAGWGMDLGGAGGADTTYAGNVGASGVGGSLPGAASSGSGLLQTGAKALGGASSLLSGGGGGGGGEGDKTTRLDPRLDELVYGDLFKRTQGLLAQQMTPEGQAGNELMKKRGMGLLDQAPRQGFDRFYPGK